MNLRAILFLAGVLGLTGCGGGLTDVSGSVKFQGKTVVYGTVVLVGTDGLPKSGPIQPDGTFRVEGVKPGTAKVYVSSPRPPGMPSPAAPKTGRDANADERSAPPKPVDPVVEKGWFPLPESVGDPNVATLTAEIEAGKPLDLDLK